MNKLKYIGISALAGSLVSLSAAQAGGVAVTGSWELSYTSLNHESTAGNKLGMNKNISFGASGDVSDGGAVTWATTIGGTDAMGLTSASMNINMGGIATLAYDSGTGGYGATAVDNIVPTAWEEIDYGLSTGISDVGMVSASKGVINLTIKAPTAGTGISFSYVSRIGGTHIADGGNDADNSGGRGLDLVVDLVNYSSPHFGSRIGFAAETEIVGQSCKGDKVLLVGPTQCNVGVYDNPYGGTAYATLALGPIHLGTQATFKDPQEVASSGIANKRSIVAGGAFVVNNLSLSYGVAWDKYKYNDAMRGTAFVGGGDGEYSAEKGPNEYETIRYRGWSAAINMGPVAIKGVRNSVDGAGQAGSSAPLKHSEINLSIAF